MANEKRLIYSESLFGEASKAEFMGFRAKERKQNFLDMISAMLDNCPTVDAVPVVRCKDCRWAEDIENVFLRDVFVEGAKNCRVKRGDDAYGLDCSVVSPNDFCSDGERREGE